MKAERLYCRFITISNMFMTFSGQHKRFPEYRPIRPENRPISKLKPDTEILHMRSVVNYQIVSSNKLVCSCVMNSCLYVEKNGHFSRFSLKNILLEENPAFSFTPMELAPPESNSSDNFTLMLIMLYVNLRPS